MLPMNKKVLFCATVDYHFHAFHLPYFKWFKEQGWEVHVAASGKMELPYVTEKYTLPIERSPFNRKNIQAYKQLKQIMDENEYKIIHCHTPVGGVLSRLAARSSRENGTKVIYTAHGFHFCKGSPLTNWIIYYPVEKWLARFTDSLVTINEEDYQLASRYKFKANQIHHVHGVGIDTEKFSPIGESQKFQLRESLGYKPNDFIMFFAAEFNRNKNQKLLIQALANIKTKVPNAKLLLAGEGSLLEACRDLARKLDVLKMVDFLGFRRDVEQLLKIADVAVSSSNREGLPVNIMEAMACGLPIICTENRGHSELILNGKNGFIVKRGDYQLFGQRMSELYSSRILQKDMGEESRKRVKPYSLANVGGELSQLYSTYMRNDIHETESKYYRTNL